MTEANDDEATGTVSDDIRRLSQQYPEAVRELQAQAWDQAEIRLLQLRFVDGYYVVAARDHRPTNPYRTTEENN